jgi:hypothetical protein
LIGYFEGLDSQRGIAWRCADSLALRTFLGLGLTEATPVHASMTLIRRRFSLMAPWQRSPLPGASDGEFGNLVCATANGWYRLWLAGCSDPVRLARKLGIYKRAVRACLLWKSGQWKVERDWRPRLRFRWFVRDEEISGMRWSSSLPQFDPVRTHSIRLPDQTSGWVCGIRWTISRRIGSESRPRRFRQSTPSL